MKPVISFRHHLTTLVAVFAALTVGIVLGSGPLTGAVERTTDSASAPATTAPPSENTYPDAFAGAVGPTLEAGKLADLPVAVVTLPGADETVVSGLSEQVAAAGGSVTARFSLTETLVDPEEKTLVESLGSQLLAQQPEGTVAPEATTYDRVGQLLGRSLATTDSSGEKVNAKATAITDSLVGAELMADPGEVPKRAPLVLVVLGEEPATDGGDAILTGLVAGLDRAATGVVVAADTADGGEGQLGRLRADPAGAAVATVDGVDTAAGRVAAVLALARAMSADGGSFGASGTDGPLPLG